MNERIDNLIEECTSVYDDLVYDGRDSYMKTTEFFDKEKFAELIVKECIAQCEEVAVDADKTSKSKFVTDAGRMLHEGMWGGAKSCSGRIKEHFGVEE